MSENNILQQVSNDWSKLREPASKQLIESRKVLQQLRSARGKDVPPSDKEIEIASLVDQLTLVCQQIDAQFQVVNKAVDEKNRCAHDSHIADLLQRLSGWHGFLKMGAIERIDFYRQWIKAMGVPDGNRDPKVIHYLAAFPKSIAACRAWEHHLLFPKKVSSIMEIGSKFGIDSLLLSRMARIGAIEPNAAMVAMAQKLEKSGFAHPSQPAVGFTQGAFHPRSTSTLPQDAFDALWFHRTPWKQWINQDGPQLISSMGELARRVHFLLFTTSEELPQRHDLITPLYNLELAGEHSEGTENFRFFVAQRRFITVAGSIFQCQDIKIHDPGWQGFESIAYGAPLIPWNNRATQLQTRRFLLSQNQVMRSFLKRTKSLNAARVHYRECEIWPSFGGLIPELPTIAGRSEDDVGHHLLLNLNARSIRLATPSLTKEEQAMIVRSTLRILRKLRSVNLHLNFLRLDNFVFTREHACFLSLEFIGYEELEDPLDAVLWLLRDLSTKETHWHGWPIEPFFPGSLNSVTEEYRTLAILALRSKNIDEFLNDQLVIQMAS